MIFKVTQCWLKQIFVINVYVHVIFLCAPHAWQLSNDIEIWFFLNKISANVLQNNREAVLWLAAHHEDKKVLGILSQEIAPAGTGMGEISLSVANVYVVRNSPHCMIICYVSLADTLDDGC